MAKTKDTRVLCNCEWRHNLSVLPLEIRAKIYDAIFEYAETGEATGLEVMEIAIFEPIRKEVERYMESYEETCEKNRNNANKRWKNATACDGTQGDATAYEDMPTHPNPNPNPNPNPEPKSDVFVNGTKPQKRFVPPTIEQVEKYIKEKGYRGVNAQTLVSHYDAQGWKRNNGRPITSWQSAVRYWASKSKGHLEERKRNLVQDETRLGGINRWMIEYTPFLVDFMEHLFTAEEIEWLCEKYGSAKIAKVLEILEDRKEYTRKHTNLYLTVKEWIDKEPPSDTPSEPQPQSEQDDYFAWLPQGASSLYRDFYVHLCECNKYFFEKVKDVLPTQEQFQSLVDDYGYDIVEYVSGTRTSLTDQSPTLYDLLADLCPEEKEWREKHGR